MMMMMDNKHKNYSSLSNQKDANVCLKCIKIHLAAVDEELRRSPRPPGPQWGPTSKGTKGRREWTERDGKEPPPKVNGSRINTRKVVDTDGLTVLFSSSPHPRRHLPSAVS